MITNTSFNTFNTPSFGMSVRMDRPGRKFFAKVFENNHKMGKEYITRQANNKSSDIFIKNSDVFVGINGKKWRVVGSIYTKKNDGKSIEELSCTRGGNFFRRPAIKTIIMETKVPLVKRYGKEGKRLAVAEEIANYQKYLSENKYPSLLNRFLGFFKNS